MTAFQSILILLAAFVAVFLQAVFNAPRLLLGAQVNLLPSLMVYASLTLPLPAMAVVAFVGGLLLDSLSANALGVSVLPLFLIGFVIQRYRGLILREQSYAQFVLGLASSAAAPPLTVLLLLNAESAPLLGWYSLWQWAVMSVIGGLATPVWFRLFGRALEALTYPPLSETGFGHDREVKRGR